MTDKPRSNQGQPPSFVLPQAISDRLQAAKDNIDYADLVRDQVEAGEGVYDDVDGNLDEKSLATAKLTGAGGQSNPDKPLETAPIDLAVAGESLRKASENVITPNTRKEYEKYVANILHCHNQKQ